MHEHVTIRRAAVDDAAAVAALIARAFSEYEPSYTPQAYAEATPDAARVARRIMRPDASVWVAEVGGLAVGTIAAIEEHGSLHIRSMAVGPGVRRRGVGNRLMGQVEAEAARRGIRRLVLWTTPFLSAATRLYLSIGFVGLPEAPTAPMGTILVPYEKML